MTTEPTPAPTINAPAAHPPSATQSCVCQALTPHCTPWPITLTPKRANPAVTILRHRLRFGRSAASTTTSACPSSANGSSASTGAKLSACGPLKVCAVLNASCGDCSSWPVKSMRGFNGSVIAIYLQLKTPARHPDGYAAMAGQRSYSADGRLRTENPGFARKPGPADAPELPPDRP